MPLEFPMTPCHVSIWLARSDEAAVTFGLFEGGRGRTLPGQGLYSRRGVGMSTLLTPSTEVESQGKVMGWHGCPLNLGPLVQVAGAGLKPVSGGRVR